jgi:MFS transporter, ACS family, D-galactonate transporter
MILGRPAPKSTAPTQWQIMALLVTVTAINYIDRGSLSIAAPAITAELKLDPEQMGFLLSSFFWTYASLQIVAGWLIDRCGVKWVLGGGFLIWSLATFGVSFANSVTSIFILRLVLGAGESVAFPSFSKIIASSFLPQNRGLPNALIDVGVKVGPGIGMLVGGFLVASFGWRSLFAVLGLGGLLWLVPWTRCAPSAETTEAGGDGAPVPPISEILRNRSAWGTFVGNFCNNYAYYFLLTWLPTYLVVERHLGMTAMAVLSALPFTASAASSLFGGWISDRWISRGGSPTLVRKSIVVSGLAGTMLILPAAIASNLTVSMIFLTLGYVASGLFSSNHWAITQTLAGPSAAGKWTGLQNGFANLSGVVAPYVTGLILARSGSFYLAFLVSTLILIVGLISYLFVVGRVEQVKWRTQRDHVRILTANSV